MTSILVPVTMIGTPIPSLSDDIANGFDVTWLDLDKPNCLTVMGANALTSPVTEKIDFRMSEALILKLLSSGI